MNVNKLLPFLLTRCLSVGIVEAGGGGAAVLDEEPPDDEDLPQDTPSEDTPPDDALDTPPPDEEDEVVITIGDETPPSAEEEEARAPEWVRELRKSNREKDRRIRELEQKVSTVTPAPSAIVVGEEPTFEGCDYDADKFKRELNAWNARKVAADAEVAKKQSAATAEKEAWDARLEHHGKLKSELKVKDYDDAEAAVEAALNVTQRGLIVHGADNSAQVNYALGKNPKTLKELAAITDPVKFAFAVAKLETKLKVTPRKTAPVPERDVRGNVAPSGVVDSQLARLQAQADKTGDRSKVAAHIRAKNQAKRAA